MALPGFTPQEELELYYLVRTIAWRLRIDEAEALLAADIRRIVQEARAEVERGLSRLDPDKLTPEAVAQALGAAQVTAETAEGEKQRVPVREAFVSSLAAVAGAVLAYSLTEQYDILSVGGIAENVQPVTGVNVAPESLRALFRGTPLSGRTLPQWVDAAMEAGFEDVIRAMDEGIAGGESYRQIVRRIMNEFSAATEREAVTLARTYVQSVAVAAQEAAYEANADILEWVEWSAIMEPGYKKTGHGTCIRCAALDGMRWRVLDKNRPYMPLHFLCRCSWVPIVDWEKLGAPELALDDKVRPFTIRRDGNIGTGGKRVILDAGQAKGSWGEWAGTLDAQFKINAIGPERYKLWRESGLPFDKFMHSLVDPKTGRLYRLEELQRFADIKIAGSIDEAEKHGV